jgi:hypothetical protein
MTRIEAETLAYNANKKGRTGNYAAEWSELNKTWIVWLYINGQIVNVLLSPEVDLG